jgi:hypothetical protein
MLISSQANSTSCLLEFSLKDGMQVDLKSECFTPESRPNNGTVQKVLE